MLDSVRRRLAGIATLLLLGALGGGAGCGGEQGDGCRFVAAGGVLDLDLRDPQVTIEVRFVSVNDDFLERIGVDFNLEAPVAPEPPSVPGGTSGHGGPIVVDGDDLGGLPGVPHLLPPDLPPFGFVPVVDFGFVPSFGPAGAFPQVLGPGCLLFDPALYSSVTPPGVVPPPPLNPSFVPDDTSIGFAILSDITTYFLLDAAQHEQGGGVVGTVQATVFDGQRLVSFLQNNQVFANELVPDFAAAKDTIAPAAPIVISGPVLSVIPFISFLERKVRIEIHPGVEMVIAVPLGPVVVNGVPSPVHVPIVRDVFGRTQVSVPDGGTVLLGGMRIGAEAEMKSDLPLLRRIPVLGPLFSPPNYLDDDKELLILVTPRIIIQEEE